MSISYLSACKRITRKYNEKWGIIMLKHKVEIIVPSTLGIEGKAPEALVSGTVRKVMEEFAKNFGGASAFKQEGARWSDELGKLVFEESTVVYAYTDEMTPEKRILVSILATTVGGKMKQEAVAYTIDGVMYFS